MICRAWFRSDQSFLDPNTNIFPPQPQGLFLRRCNPIVSIFLRSAGQQADITRHRVSFEVSGLGSTGLPEIPASGPRVLPLLTHHASFARRPFSQSVLLTSQISINHLPQTECVQTRHHVAWKLGGLAPWLTVSPDCC